VNIKRRVFAHRGGYERLSFNGRVTTHRIIKTTPFRTQETNS